MRTDEAKAISKRMLDLIVKYFPDHIPKELRKQVETLAHFDPAYRFPPNFLAQFEEHKSLSEQLEQMNKDYRYAQALKLFNTPPEGHA
jgi:hypothetical protein